MTKTTKKFKNIVIGTLLAFAVVGNAAGAYAATFNTASGDTTLKVSNYTQHPGSSAHWGSSVSAADGETLSFLISYHNTAAEKACDVRIRLNLPSTISNGQTISATVWADSTTPVTGNVTVFTNFSGSRNISMITGTDSVRWYAGPSSAKMTLPFSQSGTELLSSDGLRIGNIHPDNSGYIVARAQLSGGGQVIGNAPTAVTLHTSNISFTSATLHGAGDPNGSSTTGWFEYGTTTSLGRTSASRDLGSGTSEVDYTVSISGLERNQTYFYRAVTQNTHGTTRGSIRSFSTNDDDIFGNAPFATTQAATNITNTSATLNGTVNPNSDLTEAWFEYGPTTSLGFLTPVRTVGSSNYASTISQNVQNLSPNTIYYYRIVARNSFGTDFGSTLNFMTSSSGQISNAPIVSTNAATNVTQTSATMNGTVNPNGSTSDVWFEYGTTPSLGITTQAVNIGSGFNTISRFQNLANLSQNTTYYYRIVARNAFGTSHGNVVSFTTGTTGGQDFTNVINSLTSITNTLSRISSSLFTRTDRTTTDIVDVTTGAVTLNLIADRTQVKPGEEVTFTAEILTTTAIKNGELHLTLGNGLECSSLCTNTSLTSFRKEGSAFIFTIGDMSANSMQTFPLTLRVSEDAQEGDLATLNGTFFYDLSTTKTDQSVSDTASVEVTGESGLLASMSSFFGGFAGGVLPIIIAILIAIGIVMIGRKIIELITT